MKRPIPISRTSARRIWIVAQRLDTAEPFGAGPDAVRRAVEHLGYVQIDTINVVERCHHHILFNRIPAYRRDDLHAAQAVEKTVFEYWTHALSYVPARDLRFLLAAMKRHRSEPMRWNATVTRRDLNKVLKRVREEGALTIRDIDEKLVEKDHLWASRKPSKRALQAGFFNGQLVISERRGMVKTYELAERHFGWETMPKPATDNQIIDYLIDRALTSQGIVSLDSICYGSAALKPAVRKRLDQHARARRLQPVAVEGVEKTAFWASPETLDAQAAEPELIHILSPFDPLIIQRRRTEALFDYSHLFEAYVPKEKRKLGYFAMPVLAGEEIVAAIDLKTDRQEGRLLIQNWSWTEKADPAAHNPAIEEALGRFEAFQLAG